MYASLLLVLQEKEKKVTTTRIPNNVEVCCRCLKFPLIFSWDAFYVHIIPNGWAVLQIGSGRCPDVTFTPQCSPGKWVARFLLKRNPLNHHWISHVLIIERKSKLMIPTEIWLHDYNPVTKHLRKKMWLLIYLKNTSVVTVVMIYIYIYMI